MSVKYKLRGIGDQSNNPVIMITENYPKTDATQEQLGNALTAISDLKGYDPYDIVMTSDTTIYTVD